MDYRMFSNLLRNMVSITPHIASLERESKSRYLNNDKLQGSILDLDPQPFTRYVSDIKHTKSRIFIYAHTAIASAGNS